MKKNSIVGIIYSLVFYTLGAVGIPKESVWRGISITSNGNSARVTNNLEYSLKPGLILTSTIESQNKLKVCYWIDVFKRMIRHAEIKKGHYLEESNLEFESAKTFCVDKNTKKVISEEITKNVMYQPDSLYLFIDVYKNTGSFVRGFYNPTKINVIRK